MQLHGKTFDYKIPYKTILRLFLLPHRDNRQMFFVVSVDYPYHVNSNVCCELVKPYAEPFPKKFWSVCCLDLKLKTFLPLVSNKLENLIEYISWFCYVLLGQSGSTHQTRPDTISFLDIVV